VLWNLREEVVGKGLTLDVETDVGAEGEFGDGEVALHLLVEGAGSQEGYLSRMIA
jgi:hypothetical protein